MSTKPAKGRAKQFSHADKHEIFDFPGEYEKKSDSDTCTERCMEEEEVACDVANGSGVCEFFSPGMQLTLKGPGGFVDIGPAGVTIQGTLVNINSGGAAGAGSGSSPTAPQDAKEAKPTEPALADDHKTGQQSTPY